ncbi:MAG: methyltransferase domain-containing protein [bacterium]|nr:methyltransferase domain-containing protein [bacterium]
MSHDKHQGFFDSLAAEWDLMFTAEDLERLSHVVDKLVVTEGMDILDLGCGTGILFDLLRRRVGSSGMVTGVDFSIQMAQKAHRNFPFDNVSVVDADARNLPFAESTYDMAVSFAAFAHFSDKKRALSEIDRVLKPGAAFYILHLQSSLELAEEHNRIGGIVQDDKLPTADELREMFAASNFEQVHIEDNPGLYLAKAVNAK